MSDKFFMLLIALISICCALYAFVLTDYFFSLLLVITAAFVFDKYLKAIITPASERLRIDNRQIKYSQTNKK